MDSNILGVCPTCYKVVCSKDLSVSITDSSGTIFYHQNCEPNRMKFMKANEKLWKEEGETCKKLRETNCYTQSELSEYLGVSVTKLRKFESGKPVTHAKLLAMAYFMFFEIANMKLSENHNPNI